jgi:hypothetical protein
MTRWFRWHEGTCEDGKFRVVARNAGVTVATVMGVWAALLEDASHDDHRGRATRGEDFYAAILDLDQKELQSILEQMDRANLIACCTNDTIEITRWKERQYETDITDPTNAERQKKWREKQKKNADVTDRNATVTESKRPDTDTDTEAEKKKDCADAPLDPSVPEREYFVRGREVLGKGAGGLIGKLLKSKGGNVSLARAAIEQASQKQKPSEYVAAICRGPPAIRPNTAHQQERQTGREILDDIGKFISSSGSEADPRLLRHDTGDGPEGIRGRLGGDLIELSAAGSRTRG